MKITRHASSIVSLAFFIFLAGCESIHIPNLFGPDEVPDEVKAQTSLLDVTPNAESERKWPRLGDVPFKPKDFSAPAVYDRTIRELEQYRSEAETVRGETYTDAPAPSYVAPQDSVSVGFPALKPPQLPKPK